jgi:hypothetical protein
MELVSKSVVFKTQMLSFVKFKTLAYLNISNRFIFQLISLKKIE